MKKDLKKSMGFSDSKSDVSMNSDSKTQDAQDPDDDQIIYSLDDALDNFEESLRDNIK